jgi:hypothetical protein
MRASFCPTKFATHSRSNGESPNDADGRRFAVSSAVQLGIITSSELGVSEQGDLTWLTIR